MESKKIYVNYGSGPKAPGGWHNFDASPTLRIQRIPFLGRLIRDKLNVKFPNAVCYGDIVKGLPFKENSVDGIFCSHVLEHLSLNDFRRALVNTRKILKPGHMFRCVVPSLELFSAQYIESLQTSKRAGLPDFQASFKFMRGTLLGMEDRPRDLRGLVTSYFGNSRHLWLWDEASLTKELEDCGFRQIRAFKYNQCQDKMFLIVEDEDRFSNSVALQAIK